MHRGARWTVAAIMAMAMALVSGGVMAQEIRRGTTIRDLPRPGYEIGRWRIGNVLLLPSLTAGVGHDSNVFATSVAAINDTVFDLKPRIEIEAQGSDLNISGDAYVDARLLSEQTTENVAALGIGGEANYVADSRVTLSGGLRFDRDYLRRSDPEADPVLRRPARFNTVAANAGLQWQGNNFGIGVSASVQTTNFTDASEDDRDLTIWRGAMRLRYALSPRLGVFVEPYANDRDARLPVDRNGLNRDVATFGALAGVLFDISGRLRGELGAGGFSADPADPLPGFSGLAFNGRLDWSPQERTLVAFTAFQGDVATVQAGANGRIDTRLTLRIDQEVRHNLLVNAGLGLRRTRYRGTDRRLRVISGDAEAEYLLNRTLSLFANIAHEARASDDRLDRYDRTTASLGIRLRV